ncbi:hypothetical protein [Nocardioides sp.]|uniref:hypothetical protein n=1 Tax=Nocardioides sp. TaxID=35761 RepID=UPI003513BF5C
MSGTTRTLFLHVGPMKSGSTYLQNAATAMAPQLAGAGLLFPLDDAGAWGLQSHAVREFRRDGGGRAWDQLAARLDAHPGDALVSMEFLSLYRPEEVARLRAALPGHRILPVFTVRSALRLAPSVWQTAARNGTPEPWPEFAAGLAARGAHPAKAFFRRRQGLVRQFEAWSSLGEPAILSVPEDRSDPAELWRRFCGTLGLADRVPYRPGEAVNRSLGYPSAELVRQVQVALDDVAARRGAPLPEETRLVTKRLLSRRILIKRLREEPSIPVDAALGRWAAAWNRKVLASIEEVAPGLPAPVRAQLRVDLDVPAPDSPAYRPVEPPAPEAVAAAGDFAIAELERLAAGATTLDPAASTTTGRPAPAGATPTVRRLVALIDLLADDVARGGDIAALLG